MHTRTHRRQPALRGLAAAAAAAALVLSGAATATAETTRTFDEVGDGVRQSGDPQHSRFGDIQRFRVDHK